jgi:hypothetical protein
LRGGKLVRFVFLDEGGIAKHEPWVIVGGVFVHGDTQVAPLEDHLQGLVEKHIPAEHREGFRFSAKDIWSGGKIFKDREQWPWERRRPILDDLSQIPAIFELPIVYGFLNKPRHQVTSDTRIVSQQEKDVIAHGLAFVKCSMEIERFMRERWPNEIAQLVAEYNDQAHAHIKYAHSMMRNPASLQLDDAVKSYLPLKSIRGSVHFADKSESAPLQVADVCSFLIRRRLLNRDDRVMQFYKNLQPMMLMWPKEDGPPPSARISTAWAFGPLVLPC